MNHALQARFANTADQRASDRRILRLEARAATLAGEGGIEVHNLSPTGMLMECATALPADCALEVELPGGSTHRAQVVWADEGLFGCRFERPLTKAQLSAALLRSAPRVPKGERTLPPHTPATASQLNLAPQRRATVPDADQWPLHTRLRVIAGLALAAWAVPAAAAMWVLL